MDLPSKLRPTRAFLWSSGHSDWSDLGDLPTPPASLSGFAAFITKVEAAVQRELDRSGKEGESKAVDVEITNTGRFVRINGKGWCITYSGRG